ncbi:MAG TPA: hypothetical protein VK667_11910, partial [Ktedonobacteraceae bacterium]|nr:hypothetical protein [Ktedonobacteraceae bacterium]
ERSGGLAADIQTYRDRLEYELKVIFGARFEEEFLVVKDFIDWAKSRNIRVGPGRGSMAGVLAAYLMGIVDVDPVRYNLMFERALNPARPSLPDFDVDFQKSRREEVIQYLLARYNEAPYQAQQVGTFARLGPRGTIQRLLKTLGYSQMEAIAASKSFPDSAQITNLKASGDLNELLKEDNLHYVVREAMAKHKHFYEWATTMQDLVNGEGKHAAGVVIADEFLALHRLVPTMMVGKGEGRGQKAIVTQYDMEALKKLGVVKFDILSLDTLDVIQEVIGMIGEDPFADMVEYEDARVWKTINSGACAGVFQVEGGASRQVVRDLHIQSFEDLIAVMALGRGGANQFVGAYRQGRDAGTKHLRLNLPDKRLRRILPQGVVLYQEQVMEIGLQIAKMDHNVVDELKEAIKYKKGTVWDDLRPIFFNGGDYKGGHCVGALHNGCDVPTATKIWEMIYNYRGYGFNKCVSGDTLVTKGNGPKREVTICELYETMHGSNSPLKKKYRREGYPYILSRHEDGRLRPTKIREIYQTGKQVVFEVTTQSGKSIRSTTNHRFLTQNGWKVLSSLTLEDSLYTTSLEHDNYYPPNGRGFGHVSGNKYGVVQSGFPFGHDNPAFIDGIYSVRKNAIATIEKIQCRDCGAVNGRLEVAHLDGDNTNQEDT